MNKQQPGSEEELRKELLRLGAREYEVVALTMNPQRGLSALKYALMKGADHPIAYAIKLFDNPDWAPTGEKPRRGVNLHVGTSKPLPAPNFPENLEHAREILAMLRRGPEPDEAA